MRMGRAPGEGATGIALPIRSGPSFAGRGSGSIGINPVSSIHCASSAGNQSDSPGRITNQYGISDRAGHPRRNSAVLASAVGCNAADADGARNSSPWAPAVPNHNQMIGGDIVDGCISRRTLRRAVALLFPRSHDVEIIPARTSLKNTVIDQEISGTRHVDDAVLLTTRSGLRAKNIGFGDMILDLDSLRAHLERPSAMRHVVRNEIGD